MKSDFYIDGVGCAEFGAVLLAEHTVGATPVTHTRLKPSGGVQGWFPLSTAYELRAIYLPVLLAGPSPRDVAVQRSKLEAALSRGQIELQLPSGMYYTACLDSAGDVTDLRSNGTALTIGYNLLGYAHDPLIVHRVSNGTMFADGTAPRMACKLSCVVGVSSPSYQMAGVTWHDVEAGDALVVDGLEKRVLRNGANAINQTDLVAWPSLSPGINRLAAPDELTVAYYPIWL